MHNLFNLKMYFFPLKNDCGKQESPVSNIVAFNDELENFSLILL